MSARILDGQAVVVTGAGAGLGRAYAVALARAGAAVVVNDVNELDAREATEAIVAAGGRSVTCIGSVADWSTAQALTSTCVEVFGAIDGLVNNAAIQHVASPLEETEVRLRRIVEVNVLGSMFAAIHAFRAMSTQGRGRILNVTSGAHVGLPGMTAYGATKGAIASLTYNLSLEGAAVGVQVNALAPVAQTAMSPAEDRKDGLTRPRPEQIAPVVVSLMSGAGNLNGQIVRYDGRSLSLLAQPHFRAQGVTEDIGTVEGISRAFRTVLGPMASRVGLY